MKFGSGVTRVLVVAAVISIGLAGRATAQPLPGSSNVRLQLSAVQNALVSDDRTAFEERLGALRGSAEARTNATAQELLPTYELALRLWEVQFTSAFFAEDSDLYAQVSAYPRSADVLRRNAITDASGRRFFAAREAREFLARTSGERLRRAGIATVSAVDSSRTSGSPSVSRSRSTTTSTPGSTRTRRTRRAKE